MKNLKILYAIQGTGNGHVTRARDIIPILSKKGEVDILVSGSQSDIPLPFPIKYKMKGLGFIFGQKGGVDIWKTFCRNNLKSFIKEIRQIPIEEYDIVINDFEPISAWACLMKGKSCVSLSHQCAILNKNAPVPKRKDRIGKYILKYYAPAKTKYGFHFSKFDQQIYTPVIRKEVRNLPLSDRGHYTVYLPSFSDKKLIKLLSKFKETRWEIFTKHNHKSFYIGNCSVKPIQNDAFLKSMASSSGVICGAGFEAPAEALFLKKKLLVIPMHNQYEQHCNAAALQLLGVPVIKNLKKKRFREIQEWLKNPMTIEVDFPDLTEQIVGSLIDNHLVSDLVALNKPLLSSVD